MAKTIKQLADELNVSKQTVQYHYQRLPAKNRQRNSRGINLISLTAERIIRSKVAKPLLANNQQIGSKDQQRGSEENHDLIAVLTREIADIKTERDQQIASKDQQIASKDQQIKTLTKLLDQSQQLQLIAERKIAELKAPGHENEQLNQYTQHIKKTAQKWWRFW